MRACDLGPLLPLAYQAGVEPEGWVPFLEALARRIGAVAPGLAVVERATQAPILTASVGLDRVWLRRYEERFVHCDPWRRALERRPAGTVVAGHELVPDDVLREGEFYGAFLRPQGLFHAALAVPYEDERRIGMLRVARPPCARRFEEVELRVLRAVLPHLRNALRVHLALACARAHAAARLEGVPLAAIAIDAEGGARPAHAAALVFVGSPESS